MKIAYPSQLRRAVRILEEDFHSHPGRIVQGNRNQAAHIIGDFAFFGARVSANSRCVTNTITAPALSRYEGRGAGASETCSTGSSTLCSALASAARY